MNALSVTVTGLNELQRQLGQLQLTPAQKQELMLYLAKRVMADSKKHVLQQTDLNNSAFIPSKQRGHRMLLKLASQIAIKSLMPQSAVVGFALQTSALIAAKHQFGITDKGAAADFEKEPQNGKDQPANKGIAMALSAAGFKTGHSRATPAWIMANMTEGQAGYALRQLKAWHGEQPKTSWDIPLPARSFLGATDNEVQQYVDDIMNNILGRIRHGGSIR